MKKRIISLLLALALLCGLFVTGIEPAAAAAPSAATVAAAQSEDLYAGIEFLTDPIYNASTSTAMGDSLQVCDGYFFYNDGSGKGGVILDPYGVKQTDQRYSRVWGLSYRVLYATPYGSAKGQLLVDGKPVGQAVYTGCVNVNNGSIGKYTDCLTLTREGGTDFFDNVLHIDRLDRQDDQVRFFGNFQAVTGCDNAGDVFLLFAHSPGTGIV